MNGFEFAFSLFGLLLGLALAEGLSGLARALKSRHRVRIGWPTALLGLFVSCDVVTFWMYGWVLRDKVAIGWPVLFSGFVITAIYYVSASLIFPDASDEWEDLDAHFDKYRRLVLSGALICNIALLGSTALIGGFSNPTGLRTIIITWSFFPACILAIATPSRKVAVVCLLWLLALYPLSVVWH